MKRWLAGIMVLSLLLLASTAEARTGTSDANKSVNDIRIFEPISLAGSRYVWVEGMEPVINLTPLNSDIFYYDIDSGAGGEIMNIDIGDPSERTIQLDKLTYNTSAFNTSFRYRRFGNYSAIGFLGEKYLAAYTNDSKIASKPVNLLGRKILSKVLIDENKNHSLIEGSNFTLGAAYVLRLRDVNITSKTAVISINKNEIEVYRRIVKPDYIVVYEKAVDKVYSVYDNQKESQKDFPDFLPVIAIHVDSIKTEDGNATVVIDGVFQLSDVYTDIDPEYGLLGITEVSGTGIAMKNRIKAGLSISDNMNFVNAEGTYISPIYFIGNIRLKLANSKTLRFFAYDENMPPNHERRGSVYSGSSPVPAWDGLNFPGFWYDIDSNSFSEKLEIINISGRNIPKGYLRYDIVGVKIPLKVAGIKGSEMYGSNASFMIFGIGTEKYTAVNGKSTELSKILIEHTDSHYDKKLFAQGEVWELGEGYNLTLKTLEVRVDPRRALLSFSHDGAVLKESWVRSGGIFSYSENVSSGQMKAPKFATYVDAIFTGCCFDFAQLRYTFLTSDNITRIHKGDRIGAFRVIDVEPDFISMENDIDIYLRPGSHPNLIGNLSFRVADANELRFYPSNTRGQEISGGIEEAHEADSSKNMNQVEDNTGTNPSDKNTPAPENAVPSPSFEFYIAALSIIILFFLKMNRK